MSEKRAGATALIMLAVIVLLGGWTQKRTFEQTHRYGCPSHSYNIQP